MPKRLSKADQRKRLKLLDKRQGISVGELKKRLKSVGDGDCTSPLPIMEDAQESHNPTALQEAAAQEGATQEGAAQEAAVAPPGGTTILTPPDGTTITLIIAPPGGTKTAMPPPLTKCARVSPAQEMILLQEEATQPQAVAQDGVTPAQDETQEGEAPSQVAAQAQAAA